MKICLLCGEYPPGPHGGIGSLTQTLARGLVAQGHEVRTIGLYPPSWPGYSRERDGGVEIWRLRERSGRLRWIAPRIRLFRTIAAWARAGEVQLVEIPDFRAPAAGWPRLPVPVVARLNGSESYFAREIGRTPRRRTWLLERASLLRADAICSASRYTASRTRALFDLPGLATVIYNPVAIPRPSTLPRDANTVVFTGTLTRKKGVVSLIEAWPRVVARCPGARLHLYGKDIPDGRGRLLAPFLRARLGESAGSVAFMGHVARSRIDRALQRAAVAVFPSYAEAFGLAPVEAMITGCPTVYTARGAGPELVDHGRTGLLIDPDDPVAIAEAIVRLLRDPVLAHSVGENGRREAMARFSIPVLARQNEAFYARCLADFHSSPRRERARPALQS
jgi:glycosyltransferase involved in cell wall biosynthesis